MRIAIITFHNTLNFGATLQCTALNRVLSQMGHEVCVINYLPWYVLEKKSAFKEIKSIRSSANKIKALIKGMMYLTYANKVIKKNRKYESFINSNIVLTRKYSNVGELRTNPPPADLFICGSDQIWNPALTGNKLDKAFFLDFTDKPKVSYGASVGELDIESQKEELHNLLCDYQRISVREQTTAARLSAALNLDVTTVLDCTLLLNKEEYYRFEADYPISEAYLLLYNVQNSPTAVSIARRIAREKGLGIVDISPNPFAKLKGARKIIDIGPGEFLTLFHNAEFVVTNSFHGTVFSIIYERQFIVIPHSTRASRVTDLLETLELTDRIALEPGYVEVAPVDYGRVNRKLNVARANSFRFLSSATGQNPVESF
jgi:polysaccharide pyruvyl transferase WcaK-like protein